MRYGKKIITSLWLLLAPSVVFAGPEVGLSQLPGMMLQTIFDKEGKPLPLNAEGYVKADWAFIGKDKTGKLNAIGRLDLLTSRNAYLSSCSGALIKPPQGAGDEGAYFLTAGHCIKTSDSSDAQGLAKGQTYKDQGWNFPEKTTVTFRYYKDQSATWIQVPVKRVVYATMNRADIAVIELKESYDSLAGYGIRPFELSTEPLTPNAKFTNFGIPHEGLDKRSLGVVMSKCNAAGLTADGRTTSPVDDKFDQFTLRVMHICSVSSGSSGSPFLGTDGKIVGIVTAAGSLETPTAPTLTNSGFNKGLPTGGLVKCFDPHNGHFDASLQNCKLPKP